VSTIIDRIHPESLEHVAVHVRLGKYQPALQLLVDLMDFEGAERLCLRRGVFIDMDAFSTWTVQLRYSHQVLFQYLLTLLLNQPKSKLVENRIMHLVMSNVAFFEISQIIGALPDTWSISSTQKLFISSLRRQLQRKRMRLMERSLLEAYLEQPSVLHQPI
jgi:hypothetical protein